MLDAAALGDRRARRASSGCSASTAGCGATRACPTCSASSSRWASRALAVPALLALVQHGRAGAALGVPAHAAAAGHRHGRQPPRLPRLARRPPAVAHRQAAGDAGAGARRGRARPQRLCKELAAQPALARGRPARRRRQEARRARCTASSARARSSDVGRSRDTPRRRARDHRHAGRDAQRAQARASSCARARRRRGDDGAGALRHRLAARSACPRCGRSSSTTCSGATRCSSTTPACTASSTAARCWSPAPAARSAPSSAARSRASRRRASCSSSCREFALYAIEQEFRDRLPRARRSAR